jgi:hypothetical protein
VWILARRADGLLERLDPQPRAQERLQEVTERQVDGADLGAQAGRGDADRLGVAAALDVAAVELGNAECLDEAGMGPDEARMRPDVDDTPFRREDTDGPLHDGAEIVHVGVRERREDEVELAVGEWQRAGVPLQQLGEVSGPLARTAELVLGDVDAGQGPAELVKRGQVEAGAAAQVEAAARPGPGHPPDDVDQIWLGHEVLVVPGSDAVVVRGRHPSIVARAPWCDRGDRSTVTGATKAAQRVIQDGLVSMLRRFGLALLLTATASAIATVAVARALQPSPSPGDPVAFLRATIAQIAANDYAEAWKTLEPVQRGLVTRGRYVRCESASPIPGVLSSLRVLRVTHEDVHVAGTNGRSRAVAVKFRITISEPTLHESVVIVHTVHAVERDGRWVWILPARRLASDSSPTCGAPVTPH